MTFAERLIAIRTQKSVSQYALAKLSGITQSQISKYELGKNIPSIDAVEKMCGALNISLSDFFADQLPDDVEIEAVLYDESVVPENLTPDEKLKLEFAIRIAAAMIEEERKKNK